MKNIHIGIMVSVLFLIGLGIGTASAINWEGNTSVANRISYIGVVYCSPFVFEMNNQFHLISGAGNGNLYGFTSDGISWYNSEIANDLVGTGIGSMSKLTVFQLDGRTYLIVVSSHGAVNGYIRNGTRWESSNISKGLYGLSITTFYKNGTLRAITGIGGSDYGGYLQGFTYNGTEFVVDTNVINGLNDLYQHGWWYPNVFTYHDNLQMISGNAYGTFNGYTWNGDLWESNESLVINLPDVGWGSTPTVFFKDNQFNLISGNNPGSLYGFSENMAGIEPTPEPEPTVIPEPTVNVTVNVTVTAPPITHGNSGNGGSGSNGGGGGGSPAEPFKNVNKTYKVEKYIYRDTPTLYNFGKSGMSIYEIVITSDVNILDTEIKIEELKNVSTLTNATPLEGASYYNIWINSKRFKNAEIKFDCGKNDALLKWNNSSWEQLSVKNCVANTNTLSTTFAIVLKRDANRIMPHQPVNDYIYVNSPGKVNLKSAVDNIKKDVVVDNVKEPQTQNIFGKIIDFFTSIFGGKG